MKTKKLTIIKGRGTKAETRIETNITLYWCERLQIWVTIPDAVARTQWPGEARGQNGA